MTGVKNDLGVMDGTDFNARASGGLRHGRREMEGETEEGKERNKAAEISEVASLRLPLGTGIRRI